MRFVSIPRSAITGLTALALFGMLALGGCSSLQTGAPALKAEPEIIRSATRLQKEYVLIEGDQIEVSVWRVPEVSRTVFIRPDGNISLPLAQEIKASGLTPRELADKVRGALAGRLLNPEVNIIPITVRQPTIYVLGDVKNPGAVPYRNAATAAQAIALAGGALRSGNEVDTTIIRLSSEGYLEALPIAASTSRLGAGPLMALAGTALKPDDIVFVPESGRSEVVRLINDLLAPFTIYLNYRILEKAT
jgi:polysaccharide biosynthesis/export protein